jgi:hypothetical protein
VSVGGGVLVGVRVGVFDAAGVGVAVGTGVLVGVEVGVEGVDSSPKSVKWLDVAVTVLFVASTAESASRVQPPPLLSKKYMPAGGLPVYVIVICTLGEKDCTAPLALLAERSTGVPISCWPGGGGGAPLG